MLLDENEFASPFAPLLAPVIYWLIQTFFKLAHCFYVLLNFVRKKEVVPQIRRDNPSDQLLLLSAVEAAHRIWRKEITSVELVTAYIQRADLVNKQTNAIAQRNYGRALKMAEQIDNEVRGLDEDSQEYIELLTTRPLLGVPLSVKDHIGVKGLKLTIGLPCFANNPPLEDDAEIIKRKEIRSVMWIETENTIYGRTKNPYDQRKGVGGSSGGEGALMGGGGSVVGVGSDIGGSIRVPAMFNGIFGLKPSPGLITWKGCVPDKLVGFQAQMASLGPMCRFAKDLRPMLKILIDPEHRSYLKLDEPVDIEKIRVFYMEGSRSILSSPLASDVDEALQKVVSHFQETRNKSTIRINPPLINYAMDMWFAGLCEPGSMPVPNFFTGFNPDEALDGWSELPKYLVGKSDHVFPVLSWCIFYDFFAKFNYDAEKRVKMRETLRRQLIDLLGDDGIIIYPSTPYSGYFHNEPLWMFTHFQATAIWNCMAFPVVSVPVGLNSDRFPTAVQVIAAPGKERLILKVAEELEEVFGGWTCPPGQLQ